MIRETTQTDADAIWAMLKESGEFDEKSVAYMKEILTNYLDGKTDDLWFTADDGEPVGVAYCVPEVAAEGAWNLLMLWTRNNRHGQGHGSALVSRVEKTLTERGARLLIVETSGLPGFETARRFYEKCGFAQEARIKNFFAAGDDKIVYTKSLETNR